MLASVKRFFVITLALAGGALFLFFAMVNRQIMMIDLSPIPAVVELRLFMLVGILLLIGTLMGWVVASFECRRRYLLKKESTRRLEALENEVQAIRARNQLSQTSHGA